MFKHFKQAVSMQFAQMSRYDLFRVDTSSYALWNTYLLGFPEGPLRDEHNCVSCKKFIKSASNIVAIIDGEIVTMWDLNGLEDHYQIIADELGNIVRKCAIVDVFLHGKNTIGIDKNFQDVEGVVKTWEHFKINILDTSVRLGRELAGQISKQRDLKAIFTRALNTISSTSIKTVLNLIDDGQLYRGSEFRETLADFYKVKLAYVNYPNMNIFCWNQLVKLPVDVLGIRNSVIGTLLCNISDGVKLEKAVKAFELKVAPQNYQRPKALVTRAMIEKVKALGLDLNRRFATAKDINVGNLFYTCPIETGNVFDGLAAKATSVKGNFPKMGIDDFIKDILPYSTKVEVMVESCHQGNFMSLTTGGEDLFKWPNRVGWAYIGEVASSIKTRVKSFGGDVNGVLRFSIQWEGLDDLDAHCFEPYGEHIFFKNKGERHPSSGILDVDVQHPKDIAVENITWNNLRRMPRGNYELFVYNYKRRGKTDGFLAEIEFGDQIYSFHYDRPLCQSLHVGVAEIEFDGQNFNIKSSLPVTSGRMVWGVPTGEFREVKMIMPSPNYWSGVGAGNKHHFFILKDCINGSPVRGFFNEYLRSDLHEHRRVLEQLSGKLLCPSTSEQLSGLGFSDEGSVLCRVTGKSNRIVRITF